MNKEFMKVINAKNLFFRFSIFCLAQYISAVVFNLFFVPTNITPGGSSGLSIIIHQVTGISQASLITIIYITKHLTW